MARKPRKKGPDPKTIFGKPRRAKKAPKAPLTARQKQDANPLYNPLATLQGHDLVAAAKAVTGAQYGPILGGLKRQLTNTTTQGTALADRNAAYYKQLATEEAASVARQGAIGQMAQSQIGAANKTAQDALAAGATAAEANVAKDEAVRGKGLQGGNATAAADELRHAAGVDAGAGQQAASRAALSAQDWAGLQEGMRGSRVARGGEEQARLLNRLANQQTEIRAKTSDAEAAKGGDYVKTLLGLRQSGFENEATRQGLGLKNLDIKTKAQIAAANRKQAAADKAAGREVTRAGQDVTRANAQDRLSLDRASLDARMRHDRESERIAALKLAGGGKKEPASALAVRKGVGATTGYISAVLSYPGQSKLSRQQVAKKVKEYVARHKLGSLPDYVLGPALDLALVGHVSPRNLEILQSYGVDVDALAPYAKKRPKNTRKTAPRT